MYVTDHSDCPNNFPTDHRAPGRGDIITYVLRESNTTNTPIIGVALLDGSTFLGWVQRGYAKDGLERRLQDGGVIIRGVIQTVDEFYWPGGGGMCRRGSISIL